MDVNPTHIMYTSAADNVTATTVPAFLTKLWTLVDDPTTDELICWDASGRSFHVLDQARFAKEILPLYFKHNNIASFIRQLNMYGFRKVISNEAANMKMEKDDMEFAHQFFVQNQEYLLEYIKRKVPHTKAHGTTAAVVAVTSDDTNVAKEDYRNVLSEVTAVKDRQESLNARLDSLKIENSVLWREVASLRQQHKQQQQIVNKLIQFLLSMVQKRPLATGMKRKAPLMLAAADVPVAKMSRDTSSEKIYQVQSPEPSPAPSVSGQQPGSVVIDEVTELLNSAAASSLSSLTDAASNGLAAVAGILPNTMGQSSPSGDTLEPLAIFEDGYPPSLELTDMLDDSIEGMQTITPDELLTGANLCAPAVSCADMSQNTPVTNALALSNLFIPQPLTSVADSSRSDFSKVDIESHVDNTRLQLFDLEEYLLQSPLLDNARIHEIGDDSNDGSNTSQTRSMYGSVNGNELVQYAEPAEDLTSLYYGNTQLPSPFQPLFDPLDPVDTEEVACDFNMATPNPMETKRRQKKCKMEDVD